MLGFAIPPGNADDEHEPPLERLIHELHPWIAFGILSLFAFMNAGVSLAGPNPSRSMRAVPIGIALGLFTGSLAIQEGWVGYNRADRLGIILGSLASGLAGYLILRQALTENGEGQKALPDDGLV